MDQAGLDKLPKAAPRGGSTCFPCSPEEVDDKPPNQAQVIYFNDLFSTGIKILLLYETYEPGYTQSFCSDLAKEFSINAVEAENIKSLLAAIFNEVDIAFKQTHVDFHNALKDHTNALNARTEEALNRPPSKKKLSIPDVAERIIRKITSNSLIN